MRRWLGWREEYKFTKRHVIYGIHSKIPYCCVAFYEVWLRFLMKGNHQGFYAQLMNLTDPPGGHGFIPCPYHLFHPVKIHICTRSCGPEFYEWTEASADPDRWRNNWRNAWYHIGLIHYVKMTDPAKYLTWEKALKA